MSPISANLNSNPAYDDNRWLIVITVMLVAILEILDSTIVNVALPNMQASLGANADQISWVLTSYIVASAIMIPLTGFLTDRLGLRRLLVIDILGFMITSMLCGASTALWQIVLIRTLQGAFGAALIPLSQTVLRFTFPPDQQGKAMAIWGIGIMAAPVLGPSLGGYITSHASWRWIFYINVPVCLLSLALTFLYIKQTKTTYKKINFQQLIAMVAGVTALQLFLDQGNSYDWFQSNFILILAIIAAIGFTSFIYQSLRAKDPLVKLSLFKDRNLSIATLILALYGGSIFAKLALLPMMLESLFGYTPLLVGEVMAPRGFSSALAMLICGACMQRIEPKILIIIGMVGSTIASFMLTRITTDTGYNYFLYQGMIQGFSMGLIMVPLSYYSINTLPKNEIATGSGLFSYGRQLGTSIGISIFITIFTRQTQVSWNTLSGYTSPYRAQVQNWLNKQGYTTHSAMGHQALTNEVAKQATLMGYIDSFYAASMVLIFLIPFVLLIKKQNNKSKPKALPH